MHVPERVKESDYIFLVAIVSLFLSKDLGAHETFVLAEFLQNVSFQLLTVASFKEHRGKKR